MTGIRDNGGSGSGDIRTEAIDESGRCKDIAFVVATCDDALLECEALVENDLTTAGEAPLSSTFRTAIVASRRFLQRL